MATLNKVLVVGGGIGGMSAAITLRRSGAQVDLVDLDPGWRVYGAGITITSFVESLPKSAVGKILRRELRDAAQRQ